MEYLRSNNSCERAWQNGQRHDIQRRRVLLALPAERGIRNLDELSGRAKPSIEIRQARPLREEGVELVHRKSVLVLNREGALR